MRLHAFWSNSRKILVALAALYAACTTATFVLVGLSLKSHLPLRPWESLLLG